MEYLPLSRRLELHGLWLKSYGAEGVRLDLMGQSVRGIDMHDAVLVGARLINTDLRDTNLVGSNLIGSDLTGADLRGAKLDKADLRGTVGIR